MSKALCFGRSSLTGDDLEAAGLVRPFDLSLPPGFAYCHPRSLQRTNVKAFRGCLIAEARSRKP